MIDMEQYQMDKWLEDGLLIPAPHRLAPVVKERRPAAWQVAMAKTAVTFSIAAVCATMSLNASAVEMSRIVLSENEYSASTGPQRSGEAAVPPRYWDRLKAAMRLAPRLPEQSTADDPAPLV